MPTHSNGFLLALRGLGMGAVSSLAGVYSNQRQQMMEKLSLLPQIVASHVVISRGSGGCSAGISSITCDLCSIWLVQALFGGGLDMGNPAKWTKIA